MTRRRNMDQCECDRCGDKEFLTIDAPDQADWHDMERKTANETTQPFLLCKGCYADYKRFLEQQDKDFSKFMAEKR